ncbi:MAG: 16S rRNA (cytosine(1402)-N(4))-methyltransferase RsmH [bacterium]
MTEIVSHIPVLLGKVIEFMAPVTDKNFIDATGGPGNMSRALLERTAPSGRVLTLDYDSRIAEEQARILGAFGARSVRCRANFSRIKEIAGDEGFIPCDGILFDLGLSSAMIDRGEYGMSFTHDGPLDMRMDASSPITAEKLVNELSEKALIELFRSVDERRFAARIARAIVRARSRKPIRTTSELVSIIANAVPSRYWPRNMHVATRPFLAIRIAVNQEAENLETALGSCYDILSDGGVLVAICYSSFEDRIVKAEIGSRRERWERLSKKAVRPEADEIERNPRSRSARLRAYAKVA